MKVKRVRLPQRGVSVIPTLTRLRVNFGRSRSEYGFRVPYDGLITTVNKSQVSEKSVVHYLGRS